jgi:ubiquinone/menaquinone biosynthesis C-methylase UbiE
VRVQDAFRIVAELGDDPKSLEKEAQRHDPLYEELIRRAAILPGSKVLELGVGTAILAVKLAQRIGPKGRIYGIDVNPKMLKVAEEKKQRLGLLNLDFKEMRMEQLQFPDNSFDHVISNFGVCCAFNYDKTLGEAHRVLRPRGKLTYNHEGPRETDLSRVFWKTFSKHKVKNPSRTLRKKRQAIALQSKMIGKYTDPFAVLSKMRSIGFRNSEASIASLTLVFGTIEEYMDYQVAGSLEYAEMNREKREKFGKDCLVGLKKLLTFDELVDTGDVVFFSGYK